MTEQPYTESSTMVWTYHSFSNTSYGQASILIQPYAESSTVVQRQETYQEVYHHGMHNALWT